MKYLILRSFRSYGKYLERGTTVDESEIRSPILRCSEGKITPAVSSFTVPKEFGSDDDLKTTDSEGIVETNDKEPGKEPDKEPEKEPEKESETTEQKPTLLHVGK